MNILHLNDPTANSELVLVGLGFLVILTTYLIAKMILINKEEAKQKEKQKDKDDKNNSNLTI
jgi:hypothetical protein